MRDTTECQDDWGRDMNMIHGKANKRMENVRKKIQISRKVGRSTKRCHDNNIGDIQE